MSRPATNRAVAEEIARAYEKFDRQELIGFLAHLTKVYVVDGTMPFNLVSGAPAGHLGDVEGAEKDFTFVKLIDQLKRRLPKIPELAHFQNEDGKVTLRAGNQKITFAEDGLTSQFVASSAPAAPAGPPKGVGPAVAAATKAASGVKPKPEEKGPNLSDAQQEALNDIVARFKNLELD
jgi:hypothetical protein